MAGKAGVTIVEEKGEMKVKRETRMVVVHFWRLDQFRGLEGSEGLSQVTWGVELVCVCVCLLIDR